MSGTDHKKRLVAILAADAAGYSRLMSADEGATVAALDAARAVFRTHIESTQGRVIDMAGDSVLAVFELATAAVTAALAIQQELNGGHGDVPADRRMHFRIGVHLGEIIEKADGTIYGDGVNIAARLESLSEPGGTTVSDSVRNAVKGKVSAGFDDQGEQRVKNIADPVRAFRIQKEGSAESKPAAADPGPALTDKPSIAVLPFINMSTDAEQEFFADGITEDITNALSKISGLFVIASHSTSAYKNRSADLRQVGRELGVRYVLDGSVRKAGQRVRITAQLIETDDGHQVWAARFDRDLTDVFVLQDEITSNVVIALQVRLVEGEQARMWHKSTQSLPAWECLIQGLPHFRRFIREDNRRARSLFERSVQIDPQYAAGWVWIAWTHWADARFLWVDTPSAAVDQAAELAGKATALDAQLTDCHSLLGAIHLMRREYDAAIAAGERAVALEPNGTDAAALLAMTLNWSGRPADAAELIQKAMKLSPSQSDWHRAVLAHAYRLMGRNDEAVTIYREAIAHNPNHVGPHIGLTICYADSERIDEAKAQAKALLKISPGFTLAKYENSMTYKDREHSVRSLDALRKAGLPD